MLKVKRKPTTYVLLYISAENWLHTEMLIQQFDSFNRVFVWEKLDINMGQYGMMYYTLTLS